MFYDLSTEMQVQVHIPTQEEKRERDLRELACKNKRPVALFVDEAHALTGHTLTCLKRLMELFEDGDGRLSIVLAGHPKLRNELDKTSMEKISYRADMFSLAGFTGNQREYIHCLLKTSTDGTSEADSILTLCRATELRKKASYRASNLTSIVQQE